MRLNIQDGSYHGSTRCPWVSVCVCGGGGGGVPVGDCVRVSGQLVQDSVQDTSAWSRKFGLGDGYSEVS